MKLLYFLPAALLLLGQVNTMTAQSDVADWERAKAYTIEYLEAMPAESYSLKPTPEIRSFAEQWLHVTDANYGIAATALGIEMPYERGYHENLDNKAKDNVIKVVSAGYDFVIDGIKENGAEKMGETINLFGQFEVTRAVALNKCFEHQTHHRGQTTVYLRMAGVTPPPEKLF